MWHWKLGFLLLYEVRRLKNYLGVGVVHIFYRSLDPSKKTGSFILRSYTKNLNEKKFFELTFSKFELWWFEKNDIQIRKPSSGKIHRTIDGGFICVSLFNFKRKITQTKNKQKTKQNKFLNKLWPVFFSNNFYGSLWVMQFRFWL